MTISASSAIVRSELGRRPDLPARDGHHERELARGVEHGPHARGQLVSMTPIA